MATSNFGNFGCTQKNGDSIKTSGKNQHADIYTCPMHPEVRQAGPGHCPICGMTLVKISEATSTPSPKPSSQSTMPDNHAAVNLSTVRGQMIGVKLGTVQRKPLFKSIRAAGRLAYDPELYTAQNEYIEAIKQLESIKNSPVADIRQSTKRMFESTKLRLKLLGLSDKQIEQLRDTSTTDASLLLNKTGQNTWVYADIYEMDLPHIRPGLSAEISANFFGGKVLPGKVVSIDRVINPSTRTAKIRILLAETKAAEANIAEANIMLRPESYVDVNILSPLGEQLTVPFDAILDTGKQAWVFVADGKGNYEPHVVTTKFSAGTEVAIADGLKAGDSIVTSGNFLIDSESRLRNARQPDTVQKGSHD